MALAHRVLLDRDYANFFKHIRNKGYIILDNSLMEQDHVAMSLDKFIMAAERISPQEIVLPDVFKQGPETVRSTEQALTQLPLWARRYVQLGAVVHGRDLPEMVECYTRFAQNPDINIIYLPKVMESQLPSGRLGFMTFITLQGLIVPKPHHLLGIWNNIQEILPLSSWTAVRSCDTALPFQAGLQNVHLFSSTGPKPRRPDKFFAAVETEENSAICWNNLELLDAYASGTFSVPHTHAAKSHAAEAVRRPDAEGERVNRVGGVRLDDIAEEYRIT